MTNNTDFIGFVQKSHQINSNNNKEQQRTLVRGNGGKPEDFVICETNKGEYFKKERMFNCAA